MTKKSKKLGVRLTQDMYDGLKILIPSPLTREIILPGVWNWTDLVLFALRQVLEKYRPTALEASADLPTPTSASAAASTVGAKTARPRPTRKSALASRPKLPTKASGSKARRKKTA